MATDINLKFGASLGGGAKSTFTSLASGLKSVAKGLKDAAKEQIALGKTGAASALNETAKALDKNAKALSSYTSTTKKAATESSRLSVIVSQLAKSMQTYARYMFSSSLIMGFTNSLNAGTDAIKEHDQSLHDLKAIIGATDQEVKNMEATILSVAKNTKFSIGETAGAMKLLAQAGFSASDAINALGPIASLATGTLSTLQSTVNLVTTAIRVFNLQTSETSRVTDIFANAVNKSKLTIDKLNTAMNYIGPIAAAAGVEIEEVAASTMMLANYGLRASTIGTGLRRMLTLLLKPTASFTKAVYDAGYTMDDFNPKLTKFSTIVGKLGYIVSDAGDAVKMFGIRGASVISAFAEGGQAEFDRLSAAVLKTGTASKMASEQMKGLGNAIKNMKDKFGVLAVTMGKAGFTAAWSMLVNLVRALEDALILLASSGIGQFIMKAAGMTTAILAVGAAFVLLTKLLLSNAVVLFTAQIIEASAQMLAFSFSLKAFQAASFGTAISNLGTAFLGIAGNIKKAGLALSVLMANPAFAVIAAAIAAIGVVVAVVSYNWIRYTKHLEGVIAKNEEISGSLEIVKAGIEGYNKVLERSGDASKKFVAVKERLITTFDQFGTALKGYTEIQKEHDDYLKNESLTSYEKFEVALDKAALKAEKFIGNIKELTAEEKTLREEAFAAAEVLKDSSSSLKEQEEAVKVLANAINNRLVSSYTAQAQASYELWSRSQLLTNAWEGFKKIMVNTSPIVWAWRGVTAGIDLVGNKLFDVSELSKKLSTNILGVGDSYAYLERQAAKGNEKAQEALAQIDNYAASTSKILMEGVNPLDLTIEKIQQMGDAAAVVGKTSPAMIEKLKMVLSDLAEEAKFAADNFKAVFGSELSENGQNELKGLLYILEQSKDATADLSTHFKTLFESGDSSAFIHSLEALQALFVSGKISAEELQAVFGTVFEKLPGYAKQAKTLSEAYKTAYDEIGENFQVLQKEINNSDLSNSAKTLAMIDAYKQFTTDSLQSIKEFKRKGLALLDDYNSKVVSEAKKVGVDTTAVETKILEDKAVIYKTTLSRHKALMDQLVAYEESRRDKIISLEEEIAGIRSSYDQESRDLARDQMTDTAAYSDTKKELREILQELSSTKAGTEEWNSSMARGKTLAKQLNTEIKDGDEIIVSKAAAYNNTMTARKKLYAIELAAKEKLLSATEREEVAAQKMQETVQTSIDSTKESSDALNKTISEGLVNATNKFTKAIDKLVTLFNSFKPVIDADNMFADVNKEITEFGKKESIPVKTHIDGTQMMVDFMSNVKVMEETTIEIPAPKIAEITVEAEEAQKTIKELSTVPNIEIVARTDDAEIENLEYSIEQLDDKDVTIEATVPANDLTAVQALQSAIDKLQSKKIVIDVEYKTSGDASGAVETRAEGGIMTGDPYSAFKKMNTPLVQTGSGRRDDAPAMLTKDEYVLRSGVVKRLGLRFLNGLNAGKYALKDLVSNFNGGGAVNPMNNLNRMVIPTNKGGVVSSPVAPRKSPIFQGQDLSDFGKVQIKTGDTKFPAIVHKDVIGELQTYMRKVSLMGGNA